MKTNDEIMDFIKEGMQLVEEDIKYSKSVDSYEFGYDEGYYAALELVYAWMNGEVE